MVEMTFWSPDEDTCPDVDLVFATHMEVATHTVSFLPANDQTTILPHYNRSDTIRWIVPI